MRFKSR